MLDDERADLDQQGSGAEEASSFMQFMKEWYPAFLLMIGVLLVLMAGSAMNGYNERQAAEAAVQNAVPDKVTTLSDCKVLNKTVTVFRMISHYVDSSCGDFRITSERYHELEEGGVYDFVTTEFHGTGKPWVTGVTALP